MLNQLLHTSETKAKLIHGADVVDAAFSSAIAFGIQDEFTVCPDPYESMVRWHHTKEGLNAMLREALVEKPNA